MCKKVYQSAKLFANWMNWNRKQKTGNRRQKRVKSKQKF